MDELKIPYGCIESVRTVLVVTLEMVHMRSSPTFFFQRSFSDKMGCTTIMHKIMVFNKHLCYWIETAKFNIWFSIDFCVYSNMYLRSNEII